MAGTSTSVVIGLIVVAVATGELVGCVGGGEGDFDLSIGTMLLEGCGVWV